MNEDLEIWANKILDELKKNDINAYIWHKATTNSVYIRFEDVRLNSIRISNHSGRNKLKYKFNLRNDMGLSKSIWKKDGDIWRYYVPFNQWRDLITAIIERNNQVKTWEPSKYTYNIPKFKQK